MLAPGIYNDFVNSFFDGFSDVFAQPAAYKSRQMNNISTDIREYTDHYSLELELAGYGKEDIQIELKNGYLTVTAHHGEDSDKSQADGRYIYKERTTGQSKRSFFVGKNITKEQIHAGYENGILILDVPKEDKNKKVEQKTYIPIEG